MWLWDWELRQIGFRRLSDRYWQCDRRHGLPGSAYLSAFPETRDRQAPAGGAGRERIELCAFHVTFCLGIDCVHFYFHEVAEGVWEPGGHTSAAEIRRHRDPGELREIADRVADKFLAALGHELRLRA